jgi:carboxyl-terminal processing protease
MIDRFAVRMLLVLLGSNLAFPLFAAEPSKPAGPVPAEAAPPADPSPKTNLVFHPLSPGSSDGAVAYATARMLERYHYLRQPFSAAVSTNFFHRYIEMFDPQHLHFLQSDLADFERYRTNLDRLTLTASRVADTRPACEIYNRFVQRFQQHVDYCDELLKNEKFTFDTDEKVALVRKDLPFPKDLTEAKKLWRERLRAEYLQERLGKLDVAKKAASAKNSESNEPDKKAEPKPKKTDAEDIVETISHRYHRNLRTFINFDDDDVLGVYLTALARVYDPHSDYFNKSQLDSFGIAMNLSLFGIGAELTSEDGYCTIHRLLPGGPATKSKEIHENDRIVFVAQSNQPPVDVVDMNLNKAVQLIRGPKGTEVTLTVIPAGADSSARKVVRLVRDEIKLEDQEAKSKIIELPNGQGQETVRLGVIDLPSFYASFDPSGTRGKAEPRSTTEDVWRLLAKFKQEHVAGVILDLRHNGGGSLEEAIRLTGLFIKKGPVVQVKDFDGTIQHDDAPEQPISYDGPMIVLTSRLSASASEILAGALQDYGRAVVVGDSATHGKGTVQSVQALKDPMIRLGLANYLQQTNEPGALKITIKKFYRASGASTQLKGVVPDVVLPSILNESKEIGEVSLENPLAWDTIPTTRFEHFNMVEPYLVDLRKQSNERIAADKDFAYVREDIEQFRKQMADRTVSLNEKQRLKEKAENDARQKARDKERLARPELNEKVYEISLKQALLPGLPAPVGKTNTVARLASSKGHTISAVGTNAAVASTSGKSGTSLDEPTEEEKPPGVDATLNETEHILLDYLNALGKSNLVSADPR